MLIVSSPQDECCNFDVSLVFFIERIRSKHECVQCFGWLSKQVVFPLVTAVLCFMVIHKHILSMVNVTQRDVCYHANRQHICYSCSYVTN